MHKPPKFKLHKFQFHAYSFCLEVLQILFVMWLVKGVKIKVCSSWRALIQFVLQESVLVPLLLNINLNGINFEYDIRHSFRCSFMIRAVQIS